MDKIISNFKELSLLWFSNNLDRIIFYALNLNVFFLRNKTRIIAFLILIITYFLNTEWLHHFTFYNSHLKILIEHLSVHTIFALILYIFFEKKISELVGLGIGSKEKFYIDDYFRKIRRSSFRVRILETFTQDILEKGNKDKLIESFKSFLKNAKSKRNTPIIEILLLDPYSDYAELRIKQLLHSHLENQVNIDKEKEKWIQWLKDWSEIKKSIDEFAKSIDLGLEMRVLIYDTSPQYSIYSCDNFAYVGPYKQGVKTTEVEQAIVDLSKAFNKDYMMTFEDLSSINSKFTNSPTRELSEYLDFPHNIKNIPAVKSFVSLARMTNEAEIEEILSKDLNPRRLFQNKQCKYELYGLVKYLEQNHFHKTTERKHYNTFGTGGDELKKKTINISTMAAILASHYDDKIVVNKSGTLEVTSNVGSETFYNRLCHKLREKKNYNKYFNFNSKNDSKYVHLSTFRYEYTDQIRNVRNKLWKEGRYLDIFKVIFPISNLSNNSGQVNGVSKSEYLEFYNDIYKKLNKRGIIIYNERGSDEILEGNNKIFFHLKNGKIYEKDLNLNKTINDDNLKIYWDYYSESTVDVHVDRFINLFKQPDYILWTMAYNVALILMLEYDEDIHDLAIKVFKWFEEISK